MIHKVYLATGYTFFDSAVDSRQDNADIDKEDALPVI